MANADMVYHSYVLNVRGHEASRTSTDALCALRAALHRVEKPVSDVVVLVTPDDNATDVAYHVFAEMERQRPAGTNTAYALVKWPSFRPASAYEANNITQANSRDAYIRFQKLFADITHTLKATDFDTIFATSLRSKCEAYMKDIERLVGYGREASSRLSDDLKQSMLALSVAIIGEEDAVYKKNSAPLNFDADGIDSIHNKLLYMDDSPVNAELQIIMNHLETSRTLSGHDSTSVHREAQRNWLALSFLIGTIVNQALQRRADRVGSVWVHHFIADLMRHASAASSFHLLGVGRGAEVALAAAVPSSPFDRKLHTVLLTAATCGSQCISAKSRYPNITAQPKISPIAGPILATVSGMCAQLHGHDVIGDDDTLGAVGFVGLSKRKLSNMHIQRGQMEGEKKNNNKDDNNKVTMKAGKIYNLHMASLAASKDIGNTDVDVVASHPEVIALFWKAAQVKLENNSTTGANAGDRNTRSKWSLFMARWKALRL